MLVRLCRLLPGRACRCSSSRSHPLAAPLARDLCVCVFNMIRYVLYVLYIECQVYEVLFIGIKYAVRGGWVGVVVCLICI